MRDTVSATCVDTGAGAAGVGRAATAAGTGPGSVLPSTCTSDGPLETAVGIALCAIALVEAANLPSLARGRATAPTAMPINAGPGAFVFRLERSYRERLLFEGKINGDDRLAFALTDGSATAPVVLWHDPGII